MADNNNFTAAAEMATEQQRLLEELLKEALKNNQFAGIPTDRLMALLILRLLQEREDGRAELLSDDAAFDQQLMDAVAVAKTEAERKSADTKKSKKAAAKAKRKKKKKRRANIILSLLIGGIMSLIMIANFGSVTPLISPFSLIHQSAALAAGEGPVLPPTASRSLPKKKRQRQHQLNNDNTASPSEIIRSPLPLPATIVAPPPIFSPAAASSNHRMKSDELMSATTCFDTPNWVDKFGDGCDFYEEFPNDDGCYSYADDYAGDMGSATEHCCYCIDGGTRTCEDYRSSCQDYFDVVGIKDGVMSRLCEEAEFCSCGDHDVTIASFDWGGAYTVGLYNDCKCDFWSRFCEDSGVGEACDYAAEYCCGEYMYTWRFNYLNSPTCYCDFFNYAQIEFEYALKPKTFNISKELTNPCYMEMGHTLNSFFVERTSLEAIYNNAGGPNWVKNDGWMNGTVDHCQWYGISCGDDGYITRIELRDNNLEGQFPVYARNYTDKYGDPALESEWKYTKYGLANLYELETVDLAGNKLQGTIDYRPLYNLASLTHFDVSGNQLSGTINALVTPSITHSDYSNNNFTSMRRFDKYKGSYQSLRFCDVSNNAIRINATDRLDNIPPNIEQFFAQNNQIFGSLPDSINDLSKLHQFDVSSNALTGSLPESLNNLPQLLQFDISSNALSGQLPNFAESFLSLQELDMSNQTIGFTGSIPEDLGRLQSLKVLKLAGNKITGTIPPAIGNIAVLEVFDLSNNLLKSSIPPELGLLVGVLKRLDLSNNTLSGVIPSEIGNLQGASILLGGNLFYNSTEIESAPLSLCMLRSVKDFDLANDNILCPNERRALSDFYDSAKGAEWTDRTNWVDEYTSCCDWKGVTCDNNTKQVIQLNLSNNGLSGKLSESIGNLTSIEVLDLSDNDMKGSIPTEIVLLSNITYLRLSHNAFTGAAPDGLGETGKFQLLQLQSNRITEIPNTTRLDDSFYNESSFVTDCGVPSAFEEALQCDNCTMCCNANEDCYPQVKTRVAEKLGLNYVTFAVVLFAGLVAFGCVVVLCLYLFHKRKNRGNVLTRSTEESLERDDSYALSTIGNQSVYSYFVKESRAGWLVAFTTLGIQVVCLIFFVMASEPNLQDDNIDIQFTWKCPRDSDKCRDTADLNDAGWFIFSMLMISNLAKDCINGSKLIYHSSKTRHSIGSRIRYFIGGIGLFSITLFALYVSTIYNKVIATSNTEIIANAVIVLFVMDLDEWIFASLKASSRKWAAHSSDSDSSSGSEAEAGGAIDEMKEEAARQKAQIASQQEELMRQRDQLARQNGEIAMLRETFQNLLESHAVSSTPPESNPQPQYATKTSLTTHAAEMEDACSDKDVGEGETKNTMKDETASQEGLRIISQSQREREEITMSCDCDAEQKEEESYSETD